LTKKEDRTMTNEEKVNRFDHIQEVNRKSWLKRQTRIKLLEAKAIKAGITVTNAEVDAEMKRLKK
jgi:hypothetical protein